MRLKDMNNTTNVKKINKVMESRFGFKIDYDNLTLSKAVSIARGITEGLNQIKSSHGVHTAERNPKYMEMFMVRESLHRWMIENETKLITESEMAKSEAILAAKDIVDSLQDMLEKVSKVQNEQMPALIDTIRDQIGMEQAEQFKSAIAPVLSSLYQALTSGREGADSAARALAGEQSEQPMDMGTGSAEPMAGGPEMSPPSAEHDGMTSDEESGGDAFNATDAAAGGPGEMGRERRGVSEGRRSVKRPLKRRQA
jgi:hypothetical protein